MKYFMKLTCLNCCNGQKWRKIMLQRRQNGLREGRATERSMWERNLCLCKPSFCILWVICRYHTLVKKVHWFHMYPTLKFRTKRVLNFCLLWSQWESSFFSGICFSGAWCEKPSHFKAYSGDQFKPIYFGVRRYVVSNPYVRFVSVKHLVLEPEFYYICKLTKLEMFYATFYPWLTDCELQDLQWNTNSLTRLCQ